MSRGGRQNDNGEKGSKTAVGEGGATEHTGGKTTASGGGRCVAAGGTLDCDGAVETPVDGSPVTYLCSRAGPMSLPQGRQEALAIGCPQPMRAHSTRQWHPGEPARKCHWLQDPTGSTAKDPDDSLLDSSRSFYLAAWVTRKEAGYPARLLDNPPKFPVGSLQVNPASFPGVRRPTAGGTSSPCPSAASAASSRAARRRSGGPPTAPPAARPRRWGACSCTAERGGARGTRE